jgi:hypothetical protein
MHFNPDIVGNLTLVQMQPVHGNSALLFQIRIENDVGQKSIAFEVSSGDAVVLLQELKKLQARHKWPLPDYALPCRRSRPSLQVIK